MTKKIILAEDKKVFRNSLKETLTNIGNNIIIGEVENGQDFLNLLKTKSPDIVFMDIEMPIMNGIEATKEALKKYPALTIIGFSMYNNREYIIEMMGAGAKGYLLKSSDNYNLLQEIVNDRDAKVYFSDDVTYQANSKSSSIKNILLIDDFSTNIVVMETSLKIAGFKVSKADSGFAALDMLKDNNFTPDLIVIDYNMPKMNGAQLTAEIKKIDRFEKTPVLILSSETGKSQRIEAKKAGATGWIKKPFQIAKFMKIIDTVF